MSAPTDRPVSYDSHNHPGRRAGDRSLVALILARVGWRDLVMFVALSVASVGSWQAFTLASDIQAGRRSSNGITCAIATAVSEAGRDTIGTTQRLPPKLERSLQRLGFPPAAKRHGAAQVAAARYIKIIGDSIRQQLGPVRAAQIVHPDGTFACDRIARLGGLQPPAHPSTKG